MNAGFFRTAWAIQRIFQPLAQPAQTVIYKIRAQVAGDRAAETVLIMEPLDQAVLIVVNVNVVAVTGSDQIPVLVVRVDLGEDVGEFVLGIDEERRERAIVRAIVQVPGSVVRITVRLRLSLEKER